MVQQGQDGASFRDNKPVFHDASVRLEGNLTKNPKNIAGPGKSACVVATIACNWRSKIGEGVVFYDVKMLGDMAEDVLNDPRIQQGVRVIARGRVEQGAPYFGKVTLEDGSEARAQKQDTVILADEFSLSYRFRRSNNSGGGGFGGNSGGGFGGNAGGNSGGGFGSAPAADSAPEPSPAPKKQPLFPS